MEVNDTDSFHTVDFNIKKRFWLDNGTRLMKTDVWMKYKYGKLLRTAW